MTAFIMFTVAALICSLAAVESQLTQDAVESDGTSSKPGIKVRLSQLGLNYGANIGVDVLAAHVRQIKIPDQSGSAKVPVVRNVDYKISNMRVLLLADFFLL
jgi:hypothetical protein